MSKESAPKNLYKASGIALFVTAIVYIVGVISFLSGPQTSFTTGAEAFKALPANALVFQAQQALLAATPLVILFGIPGLYLALRAVGKWFIILAAMLLVVAVTLDTSHAVVNSSLVMLSNNYASATNEAQRAAYLAAADLALAIGSSLGAMVALPHGLAAIMISLAMLKGVFSKATSYVGLAAGLIFAIGNFLPAQISLIVFITGLPLFLIWLFATGYKLYKLEGAS